MYSLLTCCFAVIFIQSAQCSNDSLRVIQQGDKVIVRIQNRTVAVDPTVIGVDNPGFPVRSAHTNNELGTSDTMVVNTSDIKTSAGTLTPPSGSPKPTYISITTFDLDGIPAEADFKSVRFRFEFRKENRAPFRGPTRFHTLNLDYDPPIIGLKDERGSSETNFTHERYRDIPWHLEDAWTEWKIPPEFIGTTLAEIAPPTHSWDITFENEEILHELKARLQRGNHAFAILMETHCGNVQPCWTQWYGPEADDVSKRPFMEITYSGTSLPRSPLPATSTQPRISFSRSFSPSAYPVLINGRGQTVEVTIQPAFEGDFLPDALLIEETLPEGWMSPKRINQRGKYNESTNSIRWFLLKHFDKPLKYRLRVPQGVSGCHLFKGTAQYLDHARHVVVSIPEVKLCEDEHIHAVDRNADGCISKSELLSAGSAWKARDNSLPDNELMEAVRIWRMRGD